MNLVDIGAVVLLLLYVFLTFRNGFIRLTLELGVLLISLVGAFVGYGWLGSLLQNQLHLGHGYSTALGFIIIWVLLDLVGSLAVKLVLLPLIPGSLTHSRVNRYFGVIPAIAKALLVLAFFAATLTNIPLPTPIKSQLQGSVIVSQISHQTSRLTNAVFGDAINDTLQLITVEPKSEEVIHLGFTATDVTVDQAAEQRMLDLVNKERSSRGIKPLIMRTDLRDVARKHSRDMFARGYFAHVNPDGKTPFDRLKDADISYETAGENLALAPDVNVAHRGLMNSPGHKANILDPNFGHVGIGVIDGGIHGEMFSQEFTD